MLRCDPVERRAPGVCIHGGPWYDVSEIPCNRMFPADFFWVPVAIQGHKFYLEASVHDGNEYTLSEYYLETGDRYEGCPFEGGRGLQVVS